MHFSTLAALAAFTSFTLAAEASTETTDTVAATQDLQRFYGTWITNKATGTFVDLYLGDSCKAGGTPVVGWCDGPGGGYDGNTHQMWYIAPAGPNNQVQIINLGSGTAAYCDYSSGAGVVKGGPTAVKSYSKWYPTYNRVDSTWRFQSVSTFKDKPMCLDLSGSKKDNNTPILCYPCKAANDKTIANQRWNLTGIPGDKLTKWGF